MRRLLEGLAELPKRWAVFIAVVLTLLVGWLDFATGYDIGVTGFYLVPICWICWVGGRKAGLILAVFNACILGLGNFVSRHDDLHPAIPVWNALMTLTVFLATVYSLTAFLGAYRCLVKAQASLRDVNDNLEQTVQQRTAELRSEIAERKRAEEAVRASEDRLAFALETSHTGAWDLDLMDHTAYRSAEHDRLFGYPQPLPSWTYEMFLEHVLPDDRATVDAAFRAATATGGDWSFECRIRRADCKERWIWAAGRHREDVAGRPRHIAGIVQDITVRKQLEQAERLLERQEKLATLGTLTAGIAHEIRNPLTSLKARLYTLEKHLQVVPAARKDVDIISAEISRLERIVQDALSFARPSEPKLVTITTDTLLNEILGLMSSSMESRGVQLVVESSPGLLIRADGGLLKQVIINLVRNAAEAIDGAGTVTLRTRAARASLGGRETDTVVLEVVDTGKGIPPEIEKRLFDPFFSTKETGTGLGLPIAARIIEKHGGTLQYQTRPGHGTTFGVVLPREINQIAASASCSRTSQS